MHHQAKDETVAGGHRGDCPMWTRVLRSAEDAASGVADTIARPRLEPADQSGRTAPIFPAVEAELVGLLERELATGRGRPDDLVLCTRQGRPHQRRNLAQRGVGKAAENAGLGHTSPKDLRASFCSLAGRRGVDPIEAPQMTGHSPEVWARFYTRSFGKEQRDEARNKMLARIRRRLRRRRLDEAWDAEALVETQSNLNADVPQTMPGRAGLPTSWLPGQRDGTS